MGGELPTAPPPGGVRRVLPIALLALFLAGCGGSSDELTAGQTTAAEVTRAIDGDTIEVELDGGTEDVRYIGVDTPETVDPGEPVGCYGHAASRFNAGLVEGEQVRLVFDRELRDRYGRLLAYVTVDGHLVNAELVRRGYARTLVFPPNTAHADRFARLQQRAADAGKGLWGAC
jgi:micrococcal nuclease